LLRRTVPRKEKVLTFDIAVRDGFTADEMGIQTYLLLCLSFPKDRLLILKKLNKATSEELLKYRNWNAG